MKKNNLKMDKMGYFTINISHQKKQIEVEQHDYSGKVLKKTVGKNAKTLYKKMIDNKLVTDLHHAAYLGRELEKAYIAIKNNLEYVQDEPLDMKKKKK